MAWFTYRQNNSGGFFAGPVYVFVEADSHYEANERAEEEGPIYFDGVSSGNDCSCCGNRWDRCDSYDATELPELYGETQIPIENTEERLFLRKKT